MADLATLQLWLAEAELARQKLLTGARQVEFEHGDMRVRYDSSVSAMDRLDGYIEELKSKINALGGAVCGSVRRGIVLDL